MNLGDFKINKDKLNKLKEELLKYNSIDAVKSEVARLASDFKKMDFQARLSSKNQHRIKQLETRYNDVVKAISRFQVQFDREITQVISLFQKSKTEARQKFNDVKKISKTIKTKLKKQKKAKK